MGKTEAGCVAAPTRSFIQENIEGVTVSVPTSGSFIGSPAHINGLVDYVRGRTGRRNITVMLTGDCGVCGHDFDDHVSGVKCGECDCSGYISAGTSCTDMKGNIKLRKDRPPDGTDGEREVVMRGTLRHEACHEVYTDAKTAHDFFQEMQKMQKEGKGITAAKVRDLWNILEDGMIENREREELPGSFRFISARNKIDPRVGNTETLTREVVLPCPGFDPLDVDGNPLPIEERDGQKVVVIPPGAKVSMWTKAPVSLSSQIESALLASSLPEYEVGELHPEVRKCLDECQEHIDAAVTGNTADCLARAHDIHQILVDYGYVMSPEEEEAINDLRDQLGDMFSEAPDSDGEGQQAPSEGPQNGGGQSMPGNLSDALPSESGGGGEGEPDESGDDKEDSGKGKSGDSKDGDDKEDSGKGKSGDSGTDKGNGQDSANQSSSAGQNKSNPVDKETMLKNEQNGKGSVTEEEAEQAAKDATRKMESEKARQTAHNERHVRENRIAADQYSFDDGTTAVPQTTAEARVGARQPLQEEEGDFVREGNRIAQEVQKLKAMTVAPRKRKLTGNKIDHRSMHKMISGDPRVHVRKGRDFDLDLELDISLDCSGSMTDERKSQLYRAAMAISYACEGADIPLTIYGFHAGNDTFMSFKDRHSDSKKGIGAIFNFGGGGTPTGEAVRFARRRMMNSKAKNKIMIIGTDGDSNGAIAPPGQIDEAVKEGVQVLALGYQLEGNSMERNFGSSCDWKSIDNFEETYTVVADLIQNAAMKAAHKTKIR